MDIIFSLALAVAVAVGMVKVIRYAWEQDDHQRGTHRRKRFRKPDPEESARIEAEFEQLINPLRKKKP